ncbi:MAG: hypothetical protein KatS3mg068_2293 [Candidatus Sericytochromatia bacterium]|nr:MAG: hypothetical protein KatS3mg068_2293 [Candidatus Sericytochromatia bacterium]
MEEKKIATALKFDYEKDNAPSVTAIGTGEDAEYIVAVAEEFEVPVYKDPPLAKALGQLEVGDLVPPELYTAVAEVFSILFIQ